MPSAPYQRMCCGWIIDTFHKTLSWLARRLTGVCLYISLCQWGCLRCVLLIRQQAALLWWLLKLHYYPQVLIDVIQYCVRRQGLLFLYGRHAYYNTFFTAEQGNCPAGVTRLSSALMFELRKTFKMIHVFQNSLTNALRLLWKNNVAKTRQQR